MDVWVQVEEPRGRGVDLAWEPGRGIVIAGTRDTASWLGLDRGSAEGTDAGDGSRLAAVVSLGASSSAGAWVQASVEGGLLHDGRLVVVLRGPGGGPPVAAIARVAAGTTPDARWLDARSTEREVRRSRERYRRRRSADRRVDQPAWLPKGMGTGHVEPGVHSSSERALATLQTRFVRGLQELLDDDERLLAWAGRDEVAASSMPWGRKGTKAAVLVLTDRQVLWLVDHLQAGPVMTDWGVDGQLMPVEAIRAAELQPDGALRVAVADGWTVLGSQVPDASLHAVYEPLRMFVEGGAALRRHYRVDPRPFDCERLRPYGQSEEAEQRVRRVAAGTGESMLAAFYAPRRERVPTATVLLLTTSAVHVDDEVAPRAVGLAQLTDLRVTLSPLVGRIDLAAGPSSASVSFPWPLGDEATAFIRALRRAWANAA